MLISLRHRGGIFYLKTLSRPVKIPRHPLQRETGIWSKRYFIAELVGLKRLILNASDNFEKIKLPLQIMRTMEDFFRILVKIKLR